MSHANHDWPEVHGHCVPCLIEKLDAANLRVGEQARAIRNVQRALQRNENREINVGDAWALIKEAVAEKPVEEKECRCTLAAWGWEHQPSCKLYVEKRVGGLQKEDGENLTGPHPNRSH